jgi:hypothetical protein
MNRTVPATMKGFNCLILIIKTPRIQPVITEVKLKNVRGTQICPIALTNLYRDAMRVALSVLSSKLTCRTVNKNSPCKDQAARLFSMGLGRKV